MRPVFGDGNGDGEDLERRGASAREASDIAMQRRRKRKGREEKRRKLLQKQSRRFIQRRKKPCIHSTYM